MTSNQMKNRSSLPNKLALVQADMSIFDGPRTQKHSKEKRLSNVKVDGGTKELDAGLLS